MNDQPPSTAPRPEWTSDLWRIGVILFLTLATRTWVVAHTEVLSRDSIAFIRFALQLEDPPPLDRGRPDDRSRTAIIKATPQPPGYSLALMAVSWPVRAVMGRTDCDSMVLSAQLTSVLASLLLVFPLYFLGKRLFDRQTAFVATMLFQVLPVFTTISSDGLSDSLFLLMAATTLWLAAVAFDRQSAPWFSAAGFMSGLAYLVRPEGLILVLAVGLVLLGLKYRGVLAWKPLLVRSGALAAGLLVAGGPYATMIGGITNKPTGKGFLGGEDVKPSWGGPQASASPGTDVLLADWLHDSHDNRFFWASKALGSELLKTSFFVLPFFALIGIYASRQRIRANAAVALLVVVAACHLLLLWVIASRAGYVAARHTLLIVMCSSCFAALSFPVVGRFLARRPVARVGSETFWAALLAVLVVAASVPAGMKKLHANRIGNHVAGLWLAPQIREDDYVMDPFAWSEYYAGYVRQSETHHKPIKRVFIVVEDPEASPHPRLHLMPKALELVKHGRPVYQWPENKPREQAKIFIYRYDAQP